MRKLFAEALGPQLASQIDSPKHEFSLVNGFTRMYAKRFNTAPTCFLGSSRAQAICGGSGPAARLSD